MPQPEAQFRHDLRTPLNHIIGYGELLTESLEEAGIGAKEPGAAALAEVIVRARETVHLIESIPDGQLAAQAREAVRKAALSSQIDRLPGLLNVRYVADITRMRDAALRLGELAEGAVNLKPQAPATDFSRPLIDTGAPRLLVVDDDAGNRDVFRRMLERQGYAVTVAASGPECLEMLAAQSFDVVLLDVIMPGLSGFDVLSRIRQDPALGSVPVIVISALGESTAAIRCIAMGAEDYLPKPFDQVLLKARIGATLEKKRLKDKLLVQEKLASLGALTAGIAHELKNPLNFITNFASLSREIADDLGSEIEKPVPDREEIAELLRTLRENLERVESHGKRADRIVRGMLLHSHGQPGKREPADLNALIEEALSLAYHGMRAQDSAFNVTIEKDLAKGLPPVPLVTQDMSRVLVNILNNSFYATEEKRKSAASDYSPRISASTSDRGDSVEICIEDNGPGIPPQIAQKIFDPFFTTKPAGAGTGLGLSISYDIVVRAHEGSISAESEPGKFARFRILLPKQTSQRTA
jgi:signal transduction histidine kinase